ncbi:MAG: hypothetical protein WBP34_17915 [Thermoanaerobaculia bacterium]
MKESLVAKALRGFFILLPFLIAYLMAGQLVDMLLGLTQPIIDVMPGNLIRSEGMQRLFAFVVLILICILVAQIAHTALARRFGRWFEDTVMSKFPPYEVLKSLSQRLSGVEEDRLQPALMTVAPDTRILVAVVEELRDGNVTVFAPMAPAPGLGTLQIVSSSKLERLECSMADALSWPMNWGAGTEALFAKKNESVGAATKESRA